MTTATQFQVPYSFAREHGVFVRRCDAVAVVATRPDADPWAILEVRRALGRMIDLEVVPAATFERDLTESFAIAQVGDGDLDRDRSDGESLDRIIQEIPQTTDLLDVADEAPIIRLINGLIAEAIKRRASDIHVEPYESGLSVRLRIDGVLNEVARLASRAAPSLISRLKVMARLDIAERRLPQDGRMSLAIGGKTVDIRVATLPARHGERIVLRVLDREQQSLDLDRLGMTAQTVAEYRRVLREPNGIVLVTGPTGSGKTTTLYAGLAFLNDKARSILTVEDPVEYALDGVGQTHVNPKVGLTFAAGLRAILRQDPDIIMVGEIRDRETAEIAVQASLTGHLVLSTVHTNDAIGAVTRLRDIGIESYLIASTVKAIIAQRLVRRLCQVCRAPERPDGSVSALIGHETSTVYRAKGCVACKATGYSGRIGVYEFVVVDDRIRGLIHDGASEQALATVAFERAPTLMRGALDLVAAGETTLDEALRVCRSEGQGHGSV